MVNEDPLIQSQSAKNVLLSARVIKNKNKLLKEDRDKILNFANYIKNQRPLEDNIDILSNPNMIMNQSSLNQQEQNQCRTPSGPSNYSITSSQVGSHMSNFIQNQKNIQNCTELLKNHNKNKSTMNPINENEMKNIIDYCNLIK